MRLGELEGAVATAQQQAIQQEVNLNDYKSAKEQGISYVTTVANGITTDVPIDLFITMHEDYLSILVEKFEKLNKVLEDTQTALETALGVLNEDKVGE